MSFALYGDPRVFFHSCRYLMKESSFCNVEQNKGSNFFFTLSETVNPMS